MSDQQTKQIEVADIQETLEYLRDVKQNIEKDNSVSRNEVASLESHCVNVTQKLGPVNGYTVTPSTVGLESVSDFINTEIAVNLRNLTNALVERLRTIKTQMEVTLQEATRCVDYLSEGYVFNYDGDTIPANSTNRILELVTDPHAITFFELFLKDLTANGVVIKHNIGQLLNLYEKEYTVQLLGYQSTSGDAFAVIQDTYQDTPVAGTAFDYIGYMFVELLKELYQQKNQLPLTKEAVTVGIRKLAQLLINPYPENYQHSIGELIGGLLSGFGYNSDSPDSVYTKRDITSELTVIEINLQSVRDVVITIEWMEECRSGLLTFVKNIVQVPQ